MLVSMSSIVKSMVLRHLIRKILWETKDGNDTDAVLVSPNEIRDIITGEILFRSDIFFQDHCSDKKGR